MTLTLPIKLQSEPVIAYKVAELNSVRDGKFTFRGASSSGLAYGIDEDAKCFFGHDEDGHEPHDRVDCTCGFYGWKHIDPSLDRDYFDHEAHRRVLLKVEFSGEIVEYEYGYRAEHQRVVALGIGGCDFCNGSSKYLSAYITPNGEKCCKACRVRGQVLLSLEDVSKITGIKCVQLPRNADMQTRTNTQLGCTVVYTIIAAILFAIAIAITKSANVVLWMGLTLIAGLFVSTWVADWTWRKSRNINALLD